MKLDSSDYRGAFGKGGSGKSTLARFWSRQFERVLICDPNMEDAWAEGAHVTCDPAELLALVSKPGPVRICWRGHAEGSVEAFEWANRCAWAGEDFFVVWDEVERFCPGGRLPPVADKIVNAGRHRGIRLAACSRRPYQVPRTLTALLTHIAVFHTTEPRDLAYFEGYMTKEQAAQMAFLKPYHALHWTEHGVTVEKINIGRKKRTRT